MRFLKMEKVAAQIILSAKEAGDIAAIDGDKYSEFNVDRSELFGYITGLAAEGIREVEFTRVLKHDAILAELVRLGYELKMEGTELHIRW